MERVALLAHLPLFHECRAGLLRAAARKPRSRAKAKAKADYATRSAPGASWLRDVLRASVVCDDEAAVLDAFRRLAANCDVAAVKNRFRRPALNGYRTCSSPCACPPAADFICEIQIHHKALRDAAAALGAPKTYAFFRDFCALAPAAAEKALDRLVDELIDVPRGELLTLNDLVMRTLVDYAESAPDLDRFARLLDCIGARAYAAKVRSRIDTLQQRDRDRHLWSHEAADYGAALCVSDGGADVGERVRRIEADLASLEGMEIPAKERGWTASTTSRCSTGPRGASTTRGPIFPRRWTPRTRAAGQRAASCAADWAGLLQDRGDDDGALEAYRAALDVDVETFGAGDKLCATPLANLARALANVGDYVAAVDRYAACLAIRERVFGPDHGSALAALAALGRARRLAGDAAGAEDCARRGVALRTAGGPSPDATLGFLRLARLLEAKGEAAEALVYFEQALAAFEAVLGADHGTSAASRATRPAPRRRCAARSPAAAPLGRGTSACTLFANLAHVLLSSDAPGVEDALNDLGETLRAAGLYEAAEPVYRRSVAVCEKRRGRDSLEVTPKLNNLALLLQHMGRHGDEAEALSAPASRGRDDFREIWEDDERSSPSCSARGRHSDAEPKIRRSLALVEARFGADHGHAATLRGNLAALVEDKRAADAARADRDTSDDDSDGSGGGSDGGAAAEAASRAAPTPPNSPSDAAEEAVVLESRLREKTLLAAERERDARDAKTAATTLAADVARLEREKAELEIRCKGAELSPKVVKMQKRNEQLGARRDLAEALEASTREREDLAARVDGAAAAAAAAAASAASTPAAEAPSDAARPSRRGPRPSSGRARRLAAKRAARRDAEAAAGDIASWLARELGVDVDGDREGFDASAGAADYDAFANDTPVRTYDLSNARGGDDDGPMSDAEEASYQDALLGICMDLPMLRGRKASS
ncbi:hypothetical protein JL722_6869 [Aureococcus anophagefferens]|nr:hypothetical protein JL722_6869 [Aureococcus anophagefferens]